jgi:hypothetical protein
MARHRVCYNSRDLLICTYIRKIPCSKLDSDTEYRLNTRQVISEQEAGLGISEGSWHRMRLVFVWQNQRECTFGQMSKLIKEKCKHMER